MPILHSNVHKRSIGDKSKRLLPLMTALVLQMPITSAFAQDYPVVQMIKRNASSFAMDNKSGAENGQEIHLWSDNENNVNQQWLEIDRGNGYYSYQKIETNFCLDGNRGGSNAQNVYLWQCGVNNQNQHWLKVDVGGGHFRLEKRNAPGFSIDGNRGGERGQNVYLWESDNRNQNQHWFFNIVSASGGDTNTNDNNRNTNNDNCTEVTSLNEFSEYLDVSNQCIRVAPGNYSFNTGNTGPNRQFSDPSVLKFTGSNNEYIFDGVTFEFDTEILTAWGREEVHEFHVIGRNNVFTNLTMRDLGDTAPSFRARAVLMDGVNNRIEGFDISTRGSYPYGYGDIFGKGGGSVIGHRKHSGILIRGDENHLKDCNLKMGSYGHGIFVQGGDDVLIEGCHVEGELRTVSDVLAERNTPAADVDFRTVWGFNLRDLQENYRFSLQEDGIRAYSTGRIYNSDESRDTGSVTVLDSTVKYMRSGVTIGWARGDKRVENVTSLANESGFWVGSDTTVVNSRGDASVGPLFSEDVGRNNSTIDLTLLDNEVFKIGDRPAIYFAGSGHDLTLKDGTTGKQPGLVIQVGGARAGHRWLEGSDEPPLERDANEVTLNNQTPYPVVIGSNSNRADVRSCGSVTDNGSRSSVDRENSGSNFCN